MANGAVLTLDSDSSIRVRQSRIIWLSIALGYMGVWLIPFLYEFSGKGFGTMAGEAILRDHTQFKWYVIPFLLIVINLYMAEIKNRNWSAVLAGLAFFFMDVFNEVWNGLFHMATGGYAAVWMCSFPTAYQPLMGWNIEIIFMFLMMGIASTAILPEDKDALVFGKINNRHFYAVLMSIFCVIVEIILNLCGALVWNYPWWQAKFPWLIFLIGYLPFWEISFFVYDLPERKHQVAIVSLMGVVTLTALWLGISRGLI